jgi:dynactin complex subunit
MLKSVVIYGCETGSMTENVKYMGDEDFQEGIWPGN